MVDSCLMVGVMWIETDWACVCLFCQAWLVCPDTAGNLDVYINLGPYDYQTPAGCADETIHAYTGATATA